MNTKKILLKTLLLSVVLWGVSPSTYAWEKSTHHIPLVLRTLPDIDPEINHPRGPVYVPEVGQTGHTLFFPDETDLFLNIYSEDEDGELLLEYSTAVPAATQSITLPATLAGTFVIEVIRADQHFQGEIEL